MGAGEGCSNGCTGGFTGGITGTSGLKGLGMRVVFEWGGGLHLLLRKKVDNLLNRAWAFEGHFFLVNGAIILLKAGLSPLRVGFAGPCNLYTDFVLEITKPPVSSQESIPCSSVVFQTWPSRTAATRSFFTSLPVARNPRCLAFNAKHFVKLQSVTTVAQLCFCILLKFCYRSLPKIMRDAGSRGGGGVRGETVERGG